MCEGHPVDHVHLRDVRLFRPMGLPGGVPAKSGVSGGVIAVVNRQLGIATFSPRLDKYGNSVRGIQVCQELASRLGLHAFNFTNVGSSFLDVVL